MTDRRDDRGSNYREEVDRESSVSRDKRKESQPDLQAGPVQGDRKSQPKESGDSGAKPQRQNQARKGKEGGDGSKPVSGVPAASKDTNGTGGPKKVEDEKVNNSRRK